MNKLIIIPILLFGFFANCQDIIHPKKLRTEYLENPKGIDVTSPTLFWMSESTTQLQKQTAYQILAASSEAILANGKGDLWDSGKIMSDQSIQVKYEGKTLVSESVVFWKVKVWDKDGKESEWSSVASFTLGLLKPSDWKAKWIGLDKAMGAERPNAINPVLSGRMVRKEVEIKKSIQSATLYVSAAGLYEFNINGSKVGDGVLTPALSQTEKRLFYNTYDVSKLLKSGKNALGSYMGAGRWTSMRPLQEVTGEWVSDKYKSTDTLPRFKVRFPRLIAQINIVYTDGTKENIITDQTWKITTEGPITRNNEYDGESYDANKEFVGWNLAGFNDKNWLNAELVATPTPQLSAENKEPIKVMETLKPTTVKELKPGVFIYDMNQNMVGWVKLKVRGPKGTTVKMVFSELLKPDGSLYLDNMRTAQVTDYYTLKGDPKGETWEPKFVYHGFRFVEITGFPGTPDLNTIEGKVVHDGVETVGSFECSNPIMTQLHKNAYWGIRGNYRSMPTDCPQRDERFGWLGDRSIESKGEAYIFRNITLHRKWMQDIKDAQLDNGSIPDVAPTHSGMIKVYNDGVVWPSCYIIIPNLMYQLTGDKKIIEDNYDAMVKWSKLMLSNTQNSLMSKNTYGDWCMPPERMDLIWSQDPKRITSGLLLSSCYLYYDFKLIANFAKMLGKSEDAAYFGKEAEKIKNSINKVLFNNETFKYDNNTVSASAIPLGMGVVSEEYKEKVFQNMVQKLILEHGTKMGTGLIGGQWQMKSLADNGRPDLAYTLATNTEYPSWGYQIEKGATTIWELWNGDKARPDMNSGNHVMLLGDVINWMYENVGGISLDSNSPAFKKIIMKPDLSDKITSAKVSHESLYGTISSKWALNGRNFDWSIEIPTNTTALLYIPAEDETKILVNGKTVFTAEGIRFIKNENGKAILETGSGKYSITSPNAPLPSKSEFLFSPMISPGDTLSGNENQFVSIKSASPGAKIYYTLDNSAPSEKSILYSVPFKLSKSTTVKAIAVKDGLPPSIMSISQIELYNGSVNGWNYNYYEGEWNMLPDFSKEKIVSSGTINGLQVENIKKREDFWGVTFNAFIQIDVENTFTFYITSDDGSRLKIDSKEIALIDGTHGAQTGTGSIRLSKGMHKIEVEYFEAVGGQSLEVQWQLDGQPKKSLPISKIFRKSTKSKY